MHTCYMPKLHKKYLMVSILHACLLAWCNIYLPTYTIVYYYTCLRSFNKTAAPRLAVALHSGSKLLKLAENKFTQCDFTSFSMQVSANSHNFRFRLPAFHIQNLSNRCRHKYNQSISRYFRI